MNFDQIKHDRPLMSFQDVVALSTQAISQSATHTFIIVGHENCWIAVGVNGLHLYTQLSLRLLNVARFDLSRDNCLENMVTGTPGTYHQLLPVQVDHHEVRVGGQTDGFT